MTISARRLRSPVVAALLAVVCSGCYPGIAWLPDSSGFVYTGGKGDKQLLLFDVKKKASRVLVEDVGGPAWPAVRLDGKRIAVAHRTKDEKHLWLTLSVFDREGKLVHRSKKLKWGGVEDDLSTLPQVAWSPRSARVLLYCHPRTALYDLKDRKLVPVEGRLATFGNSPLRPDGKGFLTWSNKEFGWVDWDGKWRSIKPTRKWGKWADWGFIELLMLFPTRWEGPVATFTNIDRKVIGWRIDTDKLTTAEEKQRLPSTKDGGAIWDSYSFPRGATVRTVFVEPAGKAPHYRVELLAPEGKAPLVLAKSPAPGKFFPSPDGKWLAVGWSTEAPRDLRLLAPKDCRLLLVDAKGAVIARLGGGK